MNTASAAAPAEYRSYPTMTLPVFDLRVGDVVVGTNSEIVEIDAESPWVRRLTERYPAGQKTCFSYSCADELKVYRKPQPEKVSAETVGPPSTNTQNLAGIRCPRCSFESAFVVQVTLDIVVLDDGFTDHVIEPQRGLLDDDPIQCPEVRGGCGHRGTVAEFRIPEEDVATA
ncbi:hypothetical protein OVA26_16755 [Microbacterium sp. SL62]|uniref:hypothetical protein n=1 Tax=Microbacterium sp. SL62 TaxID=2995139 RepID=UPI002276400D|nr:hypothetical protein [Microbacterium sp. SL62]MCY1718589.1 hypothetical protein [Microbacterium sp. SL62]